MFQHIGAALTKQSGRRTHQPIRRNSRPAGKCESVFWESTNRTEVQQIVLAAKKFERANKQPGKRTGPLGTIAIEILEYFANVVDFRTGRLEPSIETMKLALCRSRDAICRALDALRTHGFVDWLRRFVPTGNDGAGPQVQQTSNAYKLSLPDRARALLGKYGIKAPAPDDATQKAQEREEAIETHKASLTSDERVMEMDFEDPARAEKYARYLRLIRNKRESAEKTESPSSLYNPTD